jgi:hypothetical protein
MFKKISEILRDAVIILGFLAVTIFTTYAFFAPTKTYVVSACAESAMGAGSCKKLKLKIDQ